MKLLTCKYQYTGFKTPKGQGLCWVKPGRGFLKNVAGGLFWNKAITNA